MTFPNRLKRSCLAHAGRVFSFPNYTTRSRADPSGAVIGIFCDKDADPFTRKPCDPTMSVTSTLTAPMLPIFAGTQQEALVAVTAAPVVSQLDEDRAYLKAYLASWGSAFGSDSPAGDFETFTRVAARVSAAAVTA